MYRIVSLVLAVAATPLGYGAQGVSQEAPPELRLEAFRLYRGDGTTRVKAVLEIPHQLLTVGEDKLYHYEVAVQIQDSTGLVLEKDHWAQTAHPLPGVSGTAALETMDFPVAPGTYKIVVEVTDQSAAGAKFVATRVVQGYPVQPGASDLVLSPSIRQAEPKDSMPRTGEWRHGNLVVTVTPLLRLPMAQPQLYYLLEAYTSKQDSGDVAVQIQDSSGRVLVQTRPKSLEMDSGGAVVTGGLNLAGIPPGTYQVDVTLHVQGAEVNRVGTFLVRPPPEIMPEVAAGPQTVDEYFAQMGEAQLDSAESPLIYLAESGELSVYNKEMSTPAKARFLATFWKKRDPTPDTPDNPPLVEFNRRIAEANRLYREAGRSSTPGWRTDRGRIYLKFGKPDQVWQRPEQDQILPLEVWRFTHGKDRYFIFLSRNRMGAFNLLYSNELTEPGLPNWRDEIGAYNVQAVEQYLGVSLGRRGALSP